MTTIRIDTSDIDKAMRRLTDAQKRQIPFATALAITRTAQAGKKELSKELESTFNNPSRFITRGTFNTSAKKTELSAWVGMRDKASRGASPAQYVKESFASGARGMKPYERALNGMGVLPENMRVVPGPGIKLDKSGGPNRKALAEIMGSLSRGMRVFSGRGKRMNQIGYFVVTPQKTARTERLQPGVYRRIGAGRGSRIVPVVYFVREATYKKVIDLPAIAKRLVDTVFQKEFEKALAKALETAR